MSSNYEVRDTQVEFDLPYLDLLEIITSADGKDSDYVISTCGEIIYSLEIQESSSSDLVSLNDAFVFTQYPSNSIFSGTLSLDTINQYYAIQN